MNARVPSRRQFGPSSWMLLVLLCAGWMALVASPMLAVAETSPEAAAVEEEKDPAADEKQADAAATEAKDAKSNGQAASESKPAKAKKDKASANGKQEDKATTEEKAADKPAKEAAESKPQPAAKETKSESPAEEAAEATASNPKRAKVRLAMLSLKDAMPESSGQVGPFGETSLSLREVVNRLERASQDKSISGVIIDLQNPSIGRGKIAELREAIGRFRAAGKKAYAMLETATPADYLVASACDEIVMPEAGMVLLPGIHAEAMFYKGLLGKLGIEAEFLHMGDYKGAGEPYSRDKFSEPVRENLNTLIDSLYDDLVTTIVKDRPLSIAQAKEIIDTGLLTARRAKELGLIDRVAYADTLRNELAESYEAEPLVFVKNYGQKKVDTDFSGPMGLVKLMQVMMGGGTATAKSSGKKIAVVYAIGPIMTGKSERDIFGGSIMGSTTIVEALRKANDDSQVAAIVLRIDSPGGSALASDLIWRETQVIEKPIVASMGDVAASGGYYIAMGADKIVAAPGTVTGSIGVVGGKFSTRGLYDKIGITTETFERGKNSGMFASSGKWTDSQRQVVQEMMEDVYDQFTTKAAEGRKMPVEKLRELAGGRVYSGRQAKEKGLVDQLGTLQDAIAEAKKLAGIDADAEVKIEVLPEPANFFEALFGNLDQEREVRLGAALPQGLEAIAPELIDLARRAYRLRGVFDQPAALVMPFELEIK